MAFIAWLAAETPLGLWENGHVAACGPPERFTTSSARVGWDRKMRDNLQKAKILEYQVAYGDARLSFCATKLSQFGGWLHAG